MEAAQAPEPPGSAQELAELAQKLAGDPASTVPVLRAQVYDIAEKENLLTTRVTTDWHEGPTPLSWVISEARKKIESRTSA